MAKPSNDRLPPSAPDIEAAALGCVFLDPVPSIKLLRSRFARAADAFYDLRHQLIYQAALALTDKHAPVDVPTVYQELSQASQNGKVDVVYLSSLPDKSPSAANLPYYLDVLSEKSIARRLIAKCADIIDHSYGANGDFKPFAQRAQAEILGILNEAAPTPTVSYWSPQFLAGYDTLHDPNAVIGMHDGQTTRYLCRGYGAWYIGQSGTGKSSLLLQQACLFALGRDFFGIRPVIKTPRVLIIQSENDAGDCAEPLQGILDACEFTPAEFDQLNARLRIIRCQGKTGLQFCKWMEREIIDWKSDITYVDPLLRFAGIDVSKQDQCTRFLNDHLDPVLASTGTVLVANHHMGKPKTDAKSNGGKWTIYDLAYSGLGSSELVNWARAITILSNVADDERLFELRLAKRQRRAWAMHPNGEYSTTLYIRQMEDRLFWEQTDPPDNVDSTTTTRRGGRRNAIADVAASNLFEFCNQCSTEGEGLNAIAHRLESWLATQNKDLSIGSCKRIIPLLVENGKLTKTSSSTYLKGPNA